MGEILWIRIHCSGVDMVYRKIDSEVRIGGSGRKFHIGNFIWRCHAGVTMAGIYIDIRFMGE